WYGARLNWLEAPAPQSGVLLPYGNSRLVAAARCDRHQAALIEFGVDVELLIARINAFSIGHHPHLDEVNGRVERVVLLGVPDAAAGTHALSEARIDQALVAKCIFVLEFARHNPGDDLHILV